MVLSPATSRLLLFPRTASRLSSSLLLRVVTMASTSSGDPTAPKKRSEHLELTADKSRQGDTLDAKISRIRQLSGTVKSFTLEVSSSATAPRFKAGQWVDFFIPGLSHVGGYSMYSSPDFLREFGTLDLAVKSSEWPPAKWLHEEAKEGDRVKIRIGGDFHYPNDVSALSQRHSLLLIAGGVGINPIFSIFQHAHKAIERGPDARSPSQIILLQSARSSSELLFRDATRDCCLKSSSSTTEFFVTGTDDVGSDPSHVHKRRCGQEDLKRALETLRRDEVDIFSFLCGPPDMIKELASHLEGLGVLKKNIFYEIWW